jgi:taurine dioxygenase
MAADGTQDQIGIQLKLTKVAGRIGAVVHDVRLAGDLDGETVTAISRALGRHKVLFFRDQGHLDDAEQERFAERLGTPAPHPTVPVREGSSYLLELDSARGGRANSWHTDVTFVEAYPKASILRAVTVPDAGGDTVWANTATAFEDLSPELQTLAQSLRAVHTNLYDYAATKQGASAEEIKRHREVFASTVYETEHPVVRVHPETSEKTLVLGHFLKNFVGLSAKDSQRLFAILQEHVIRLENTVRWRWAVGDVAIWDNRATQHYAINDYGDARRIVRRVTLAGETPIGVDGRTSRALAPSQTAKAA